MIRISGNGFNPAAMAGQYGNNSMEAYIFNILSSSIQTYDYNSLNELKFELTLRKDIVNASIKLYKSDFGFSTFRESKCNELFWERTRQGGFLLKEGAEPSAAIDDIYRNSSKYSTECATAMVIVYYKACVDSLSYKLFNVVFSQLYLMNWHYVNENLGLNTTYAPKDNLPGDCRYFKNPQVNPLTPEWQGENTIYLGNGNYYGHGIGIKTGDEIIATLNRQRMAGAEESAHLLDSVTRPGFKQLAYEYKKNF